MTIHSAKSNFQIFSASGIYREGAKNKQILHVFAISLT